MSDRNSPPAPSIGARHPRTQHDHFVPCPWRPALAAVRSAAGLADPEVRISGSLDLPASGHLSVPGPAARTAFRPAPVGLRPGIQRIACSRGGLSTDPGPDRNPPADQVTDWADRTMLEAVPVSTTAQRQLPAGDEPLPALGDAIIVTATRLRAAARWEPAEAAWSPLFTAESWKWTATATAITSDLTEAVLRSLAQQASQLPGLPAAALPLTRAADVAAAACASWRETAAAPPTPSTQPPPPSAPRASPWRWPGQPPARAAWPTTSPPRTQPQAPEDQEAAESSNSSTSSARESATRPRRATGQQPARQNRSSEKPGFRVDIAISQNR
jgi:hypothetical protein